MSQTLFDKLWETHLVHQGRNGEPDLLYIDLHLLHEVTSPQAFESIERAGRRVRRPDLTLATVDHNVPTAGRHAPWTDPLAVKQVQRLRENCRAHGVPLFDVADERQGIVHVVGPEQGLTQPGMTIVCGDSHTATHGAFGALAFGIGTSEVEHVLATQTLPQKRPRTMAVNIEGEPTPGVSAKDIILALIEKIGVSGGTGHVLEYRGSFIRGASMEARMTICNMSIEAGARAGLVSPDETTFAWLLGRPAVGGRPGDDGWHARVQRWRSYATDEGAAFDRSVDLDASQLAPRVTWGTTPAQNVGVDGRVPHPDDTPDPELARRAQAYMGLDAGQSIHEVPVNRVFIGSCTNGRIEDLRAAAKVVAGRRVASGVDAMVVPGSGLVKAQAEAEGLAAIFEAAGLQWREPGCSMCLGMNPDTLSPGQRCASTSNRNFEGRQGRGGRTHLVSPAMAAAAAVTGRLADVRELVA